MNSEVLFGTIAATVIFAMLGVAIQPIFTDISQKQPYWPAADEPQRIEVRLVGMDNVGASDEGDKSSGSAAREGNDLEESSPSLD